LAGLGQHLLGQRQHAADVVAAGQLGHHAAIGLVHVDLAVQRVRQQHGHAGVAGAHQRHAGFVARRFDAQHDKPEKEEVKIGFIPLTDCASVVMASVLGFDKKYGVKIIPTKEASWAGVRDKLVNGELDMAHVLYGLIYGVHLGVAAPRRTWPC
jgi:hypothetical protein